MGIWDNVSSMLGKGADAAGRFANATNLKFKLGEEQRKRRDLAAELGESLYETVAANPSLAAGRERILADMAACDAEIARIKEEVDRIAQENEALKAEAVSYLCPVCGSTLARNARFCSTCGTPLAPLSSDGWVSQSDEAAENKAQQPGSWQEPSCQDASRQPAPSAQQPGPTYVSVETSRPQPSRDEEGGR